MSEKLLQHHRGTEDPALRELRRSLSCTQTEIAQAYNQFNYASDPDLIDACVYQISSLQCRYNYLIRQIKAADGDATPCAAAKEGTAP